MSEERQFQVVSVERNSPGQLEAYCDLLVRDGFEPAGGLVAAGDRLIQAMWRRQDEVLAQALDLSRAADTGPTEEGADDDGNT